MFIYDATKTSKIKGKTVNRLVSIDWDVIHSECSKEEVKYLESMRGISYSGSYDLGKERLLHLLKRIKTQQTVFMYDCSYDKPQVYREFPLLFSVIKVNAQDIYGKTGPMYAAQKNSLNILNLIDWHSKKIDFKLRDNDGYNLLDIACDYGSLEWVKFATKHIPITEYANNKNKETPLMIALRNSNSDPSRYEDLIKFLLSQEANLSARNIYGQTINDYLSDAPILIKGLVYQHLNKTTKIETPKRQNQWVFSPCINTNITINSITKEKE